MHHFVLAALAGFDFSNLLSLDNLTWAIGALLTFVIGLKGVSTWLTASRRKWIGFAAHHAFLVVEDAQSNGLLDAPKVVAGVKAADAWLAANGFRALSDQEKAAVHLEFKALNGQAEVKAALAAASSPSQPAAK